MLFGRNKNKKKTPEKTPVWFMWLMGGFVAYALVTNIFTDKVDEVRQKTGEATLDDMEYFNFNVVGSQGMGGKALPLFLRDVTVGQGAAADCWHEASIHYKLYDDKGRLIEDTREGQPVRFHVGGAEVPLAIERATLGMREGGLRAATSSPALLYGDDRFRHPQMGKKQYGGVMVELLSVQRPPNLPFSDLGLRVYEDAVGEGKLGQCTDRMRVRIRGWDTLGKALWKDIGLPAIWVRLGEGAAPYAVERGLMGMRVGGKRTLIVPPGYMKPLFAADSGQKTVEDILAQPESEGAAEEQPQADAQTDAAEPLSPSQRAFAEVKEWMKDEFPWESLPVPSGEVIILEIELLPEQIDLPGQPEQSPTNQS